MTTQREINATMAAIADKVRDDRAAGRFTVATRVRAVDGMVCEVAEGAWRFRADLPASKGGTGSAPDPGFFGRAALGICAVQTYTVFLARHEVPVSGIEVTVESDLDVAGALGVDPDVRPGYGALRCQVTITSDADPDAIAAALDDADRHSPWRDNFASPVPVTRALAVRRAVDPGSAG